MSAGYLYAEPVMRSGLMYALVPTNELQAARVESREVVIPKSDSFASAIACGQVDGVLVLEK